MAKHKKQKVNIKIIKLLTFLFGIYVISLFLPPFQGYSWYPIAFVKCGGQPYIASDVAAAHSYEVPGDGFYDGPNMLTQRDNYYCTDTQAQAAGYHPYTWGADRCRVLESADPPKTICNDPANIWLIYLPAVVLISSLSGLYLMNGKWRSLGKAIGRRLNKN